MDQCDTNRFSVDKKFLCNHCPRKFYTKTMFEFHFISGHGSLPPDRSEVQIKAEKIIPSKCQMCQRGSSTADGNALTPKCKECTRSSRVKENPKKHFSNVDLNLNPHKCQECQRSFRQKGILRRHVGNVHEKNTPHKCLECQRSFGRKEHLRRHIE